MKSKRKRLLQREVAVITIDDNVAHWNGYDFKSFAQGVAHVYRLIEDGELNPDIEYENVVFTQGYGGYDGDIELEHITVYADRWETAEETNNRVATEAAVRKEARARKAKQAEVEYETFLKLKEKYEPT